MFYDLLKTAAKSGGVSLAFIGRSIGKTNSYVNNAISRGSDPSTANASRMLGVCGYVLCALPRDKVPDDALVITPPNNDADATRRALERRREQLCRNLAAVDEQLGKHN